MAEPQPPATGRRRTARRLIGLFLFVALALATGAVVVVVLSRTSLVEAVVRQQLAARGLTDVDFAVASIDLSGARLVGLRFGDRVRADAVGLTYTAAGLADGRIDRVVVRGLDVDASDIDALRALAAGDAPAGPPAGLPPVRLSGARIHGETTTLAFSLRLDGDLEPDLSGRFVVVLEEARAAVGGRMARISDLRAEIAVAPGATGMDARFAEGRLADAAEPSWLAPLTIAGRAVLAGGLTELAVTASGAAGRLRLTADGAYDAAAAEGEVTVRLDPLRFAPDGLRPADLAPALAAVAPLTGTVAGRTDLTVRNGVVSGQGDLGAWDFAIRAGGIDVAGAAMTVHLESADGRQIGIRLADAGGRVAAAGETIVVTAAEGAGSATLADGAVRFRLDRASLAHDRGLPWLLPLDLAGDADLAGSRVSFRLAATTEGGDARITVAGDHDLTGGRGGARLTFDPLVVGGDGPGLDAISPAASGLPVSGRIAGDAELTWQADRLDATASIDLADGAWTDDDVSVRDLSTRLRVRLAEAGLTAEAGGLAAEVAAAGQTVRLADGKIRATLEDDGVVVADLAGVTVADVAPSPWFDAMTVGGRLRLDGDAARFEARLSHGGDEILVVDGRHGTASARGEAVVHLGPLAFVPGGPQPHHLLPPLAAIESVGGSLAGDVRLRWSGADVDGTALLRLDDLSFASDTVAVEGLSGVVGLDSLDPPTARAARTLRARRIVGAVPVEAPILRFRFDGAGAGRLLVDHAEAGLAGGLISVDDATIDAGGGENRLVVRLQGVDLERLLALFALDGVGGSGSVSGTVPLIVGADTVRIDDGLLTADGGGVLSFRSEAARRVLDAGGEQARLLLSVLEDFHYQVLSLRVARSDGAAALSLHTEGHNPAVRDGHPFVLNVNLTGNLERVLAVVLEGYRLSDRAIRATVGGRR